jgi:hypothetical protein
VIAAYIIIGVVVGLVAAHREYQDGAAPGAADSAGAVGLFAALFWPLILVMLLFGAAAKLWERIP